MRGPMLNNLVLPNRAEIQMVDKNLVPIRLAAVLFETRLFARRKNDFILGPFVSDDSGLVVIQKEDLESGIADNYAEDLMGHSRFDGCVPTVQIRILTEDDIRRAVASRRNVWTGLLPGERNRWSTIEQLLTLYEAANNKSLRTEHSSPIRCDWNEAGAEYSYNYVLSER